MEHKTVKVEGMHCGSCEKMVTVALEDLGAANVVASRTAGSVEYDADPAVVSDVAVKAAIEDCGFSVVA
jgi:Cu+-exporting ATPase